MTCKKTHLNILIAEDGKDLQFLMKHWMDKFGHTYKIVDDGEQCAESFKNEHFDMIIMDIYMPVMNGFDSTKMIREFNEWGERIPIFALTAAINNNEKDIIRESGMNAYLHKPVDIEILEDTINKCQRHIEFDIKNEDSTPFWYDNSSTETFKKVL